MLYQDASQPIAQRVADLLSHMTLAEKIGQLYQVPGWKAYQRTGGRLSLSDWIKPLVEQGLGSLYGLFRADPWTEVTLETGLHAREAATVANAIQRHALEQTRLAIPLIFAEECSHGVMGIGTTVFPAPIGLASTWNPTLITRMGEAIAAEARAVGATMTLSPVLDIPRDPRWGRTEETFGEDPFLSGELGAAVVRGFQGDRLDTDHTICVTLKHIGAYGAGEGGHNQAPAHLGARELQEVHLAPFHKALQAGAGAVMPSYGAIDGMPNHANAALLTGILREEWGFEGVVISDGGGLPMLAGGHHIASDDAAARAMAIEAGVDLELSWQPAGEDYASAVARGLLSARALDRAVGRILALKFRLGLFESPFITEDLAATTVFADAHRALALQAARESIVLLKNAHNMLPLPGTLRRIAVIGPNADAPYNQLGDYTGIQRREDVHTVLDGIRGIVAPDCQVRYAQGCTVTGAATDGFDEALAAARGAEVAIVVLGTSSSRYAAGAAFDAHTGAVQVGDVSAGAVEMDCAEGVDSATLALSGVQEELVRLLHATGVPVVVVLINGRPVELPWLAEQIPAIVEAWYPGQQGGRAIAEVLFGAYNPGGKLAITFPKSTLQLPLYYNALPKARVPYCNLDAQPLYPFGYGLSYTTFAYYDCRLTPETITADDSAEVSVNVSNTGAVAGDEVVQLYLRDDLAGVCRPEQELKGFQRIHLAPGETTTVRFTVSAEQLQYLNAEMRWTVDPGTFTVMVGGNSLETCRVQLTVRE